MKNLIIFHFNYKNIILKVIKKKVYYKFKQDQIFTVNVAEILVLLLKKKTLIRKIKILLVKSK
jgi:hypothetical protein